MRGGTDPLKNERRTAETENSESGRDTQAPLVSLNRVTPVRGMLVDRCSRLTDIRESPFRVIVTVARCTDTEGMKRGKHLQIGAGSRSKSQAKAEDTARRSRKRAGERAWKQEAKHDQ